MPSNHDYEYENRVNAWCKRVGCRRSTARANKVLKHWPINYFSEGFDHTHVYYFPKSKTHFLITEPYEDVDRARKYVEDMANKHNIKYSIALGENNAGLWNPGECFAMLVGPPGFEHVMKDAAKKLPIK